VRPILTAVRANPDGPAGRADADLVGWGQGKSVLVALGTLLSGLALVLGILALNATTGGVAATTATPWIVALLVCAALMGLLCVVQGRLWQRATRRWQSSDVSTDGLHRFSWWLHLVSYPVVVAGILTGIKASKEVGFAGSVATFATLALVPLIAAQVLGAVQVVRTEGPSGTVPHHLRRLSARIERSRHED
jgi:hypothetical protein